MKKVLFLIHDLSVGGAEKVLVNLVNNMDRSKFDISVISLFGGGINEQFLKQDIRYHSVFKKAIPGNSKIMKLLSPEQLHKVCVKEKYDIEIAYLEGPSARIISGCPDKDTKLVSWIHVEQHTGKVAAGAFRSYRESVNCYKKFDQIVCVSDYVKNDFKVIYPDIKNVQVLYNTNETMQILERAQEKVESGIFKDSEIKICGVGKIVPVKGFDKLARIHCRLRKEGYPIHTYILGTGDCKEEIENYIRRQAEGDNFTFLGYQTNPYKYISKCNLFVCASSAEGFSTAATEALILGIPIVTTSVSGMKEMLGENNEFGIITENKEESLYLGIKRLLDYPELLSHYRSQAYIRGKCFSKEKTVKAVENLFIQLI